jgi:HEAT repeat protein
MSEINDELSAALRQLDSADLEQRVRSVEALAHVSNRIVDRVIEELAKPGPARGLIFERLGRFGTVAIEPLEQLLWRSDDHELRILCAAALLYLDSKAGVQVLLDAVTPDEPLVCIAVRALSGAGVTEAASRIQNAIHECDLAQTDVLECLVSALRRLAGTLPADIQARLKAVEPAWFRDSLIN